MKVSLRVLASLNDRLEPDRADIDMLRYYLGSDAPPADLDELACAVVQKALEQRARNRAVMKGVERLSHLEANLL
jgi:hypothetical protein